MTTTEAKRIIREAVEEAVENGKPLLYRLPDASEYERIELSSMIHMCEQEKVDILNYAGILQLMTVGFGKVFGREAVTIALNAYDMIIERYGEAVRLLRFARRISIFLLISVQSFPCLRKSPRILLWCE